MSRFKIELTAPSLRALRELRLWHWTKVVSNGKSALEAENRLLADMQRTGRPAESFPHSKAVVKNYDRAHSRHMKAVQALNDLFPRPGDTAERDLHNQEAFNASGRKKRADHRKPR